MKREPTKHQEQELDRRKAMPVALIQRPLKFIASRVGDSSDNTHSTESATTIKSSHKDSPIYKAAALFANRGEGALLQSIARAFL